MSSSADWNCSLLAWGLPSDAKTFSGYARQVTLGIAARGALRHEYSLKQMHPMDAFSGAFSLRMKGWRPKVSINRRWMWSQRGSEQIAQRLERTLRTTGDTGDFIQFGSLCELPPGVGRHCVQLDMTIPQAHRAGKFAVAGLANKQIDEAIAVQRRVFQSAFHIFAATEWAKTGVIDDFDIPADRISVLYTGSNLHLPTDLKVMRKPHQILFVGIDWERKGGPELVEAFRLLRRRMADAELVIVGCSPRIECDGVRVEGYLHPGRVEDQRRLAELYLESSCFAMLSEFEPMGIVFIEAYRAGVPVVAFDSGSRSELIEHGKTGILCLDLEPKTVADALERVLSDDHVRQSMASEARRLASEVFTWEKVVDRIGAALAPPARSPKLKPASAFASVSLAAR